jgi:hypothetical protein
MQKAESSRGLDQYCSKGHLQRWIQEASPRVALPYSLSQGQSQMLAFFPSRRQDTLEKETTYRETPFQSASPPALHIAEKACKIPYVDHPDRCQ